MARGRWLKPEFFRSKTLAPLPLRARFTFAGLWCMADDSGTLTDDADLIKADVWLRDRQVSPEDVDDDLAGLAEAGVICRYDIEGRRYLHVLGWSDPACEWFQKINNPSRNRLPQCLADHGPPALFTTTALTQHCGSATTGLTQEQVSATTALSEGRSRETTREGKEREGKGRDTSLGTRLPEDFQPSDADLAYAKDKAPDVDHSRETEKFINYWLSTAGARGRKRDWHRTWRNWMINTQDDLVRRRPVPAASAGEPAPWGIGLRSTFGEDTPADE